MVHNRLLQQLIYWGVWLVIPLIWEIFAGLFSAFAVVFKRIFTKKRKELDFYPGVSILIPVYNSASTLEGCLKSLVEQDYPMEQIEVFLVDNGSIDNSYDVFAEFQSKHPELRLWWYTSEQGKSKALNKGIFGSNGKYIINIDSDGRLDRQAIKNMVKMFENDDRIACATGVVLIDPALVDRTRNKFIKAVRLCEMFEYTESFLVGRNFQAMFNMVYTLAGAFSCFRREALIKTQMYNAETLGEDTHMTFQIKNFAGGRVVMCEDAFFYVEPIENLDRVYIQRQRWQRAELEVANLFISQHIGGIYDFITKPAVRKLVSDHTLVFPRLIWFFGMFYLYFNNYPLSLLVGANVLLYAAYMVNSIIYMLVGGLYLGKQKHTLNYVFRHWYICIILPFYRFIVYWVRVAGIVNSLKTESRWRDKYFRE